jgi:transcriptional regulator with PAS, ATPase and Fis domain
MRQESEGLRETAVSRDIYDGKKDLSDGQLDLLFQVMDNENDLTVADGRGVVINVSDSYEEHFFVKREDVIGKSVFELEKEGVFRPSVTAIVLREKKKATILQRNKRGEFYLTTGVPIFNDDGSIKYAISFNSIDIANVSTLLDKYNRLNELMREHDEVVGSLRTREVRGGGVLNRSKPMRAVDELAARIANVDANVLITGETGVGKSIIAYNIHNAGFRRQGPFVEINCAAIPPNLVEAELFGYEKGSFTGADRNGKMGKIEFAGGGTLFLDEIGDLPLDLQTKFLQVIQDKAITRLGSLKKIEVDFRLIAATNTDLDAQMRKKRFREDLYYRLNVIPIHIPPLRERTEDIRPLTQYFLDRFNRQYNRDVRLDPAVYDILEKRSWPGNIRQLENLLEYMVVIIGHNTVKLEDLPPEIAAPPGCVPKKPVSEWGRAPDMQEDSKPPGIVPKKTVLEGKLDALIDEYERSIFENAWKKHKTGAAVGAALGISQATAARKLRKYVAEYGSKNMA